MLGKIGPFREPMKKLGKVGEGVVDFFTEGITEGAQTFIGNFTEKMAVSPPRTRPGSPNTPGSRHFWEEMAEDVPESTVLGAAAGGVRIPGRERRGAPDQQARRGQAVGAAPEGNPDGPSDRARVRRARGTREREVVPAGAIQESATGPVRRDVVVPRERGDHSVERDDINLKQWFGQMMTETPGGAPSAQTLFQEAQRGRLLAVHSFSPEGARAIRALDGRVPAISFALVDPATVSEKTGPLLYGNMTYIAPPSLVDPSSGSVDVYGTPVATGYLSELTILSEDETGAPVLLPIEGTSEAPLTPEQTLASATAAGERHQRDGLQPSRHGDRRRLAPIHSGAA